MHIAGIDTAQHLADRFGAQTTVTTLAAAEGNRLIRERQRIAHGAARRARQQMQRPRLGRNALRTQHMLQVGKHGFRHHRAQIELQTAAQHRHRHLLRIGRGQHELEIFGGLFQRLQHGVEGGIGQHVHFVDHEDLEAALHRLVDGLFQQTLHLVHATVGGGIELDVIDKAAGIDLGTGLAHTTRLGRDLTMAVRPGTVQRLGQNARYRGLADTTRTGEHVGMVQALRVQGIGQRLHHVLLPHHFEEAARTIFAGEDQIRHGAILPAGRWPAGAKQKLDAAPANPGSRYEKRTIFFWKIVLLRGAGCRIRTDDLPLTRRVLYQLS